MVTCEDRESLGWLESLVSKIVPWAGAKLQIIPESELPRPTVAITFVPSSEVDSAEAVRLLNTERGAKLRALEGASQQVRRGRVCNNTLLG